MEQVLGSSLLVFFGVTVVLFGGCAMMTGRALALTWRPAWQALPYGLLLGAGCRFITFALFEGELLSLTGYVVSSAVLIGLALLTYRIVLVRLMVAQYPWLYVASGPFGWRQRDAK